VLELFKISKDVKPLMVKLDARKKLLMLLISVLIGV
jgi:hypothetical protein